MEEMPTSPDPGTPETTPESAAESQPVKQFEAPPEAEGVSIFENPIEDSAIFETEENIAEATETRSREPRETKEDSSEEVSEETQWKKTYEEESVKQWNEFEEKNPEKVEKCRKEKKNWYEKARIKAEQVMKGLDPEYVVEVQDSIVSPDDNDKAEYKTITLSFRSPKEPEFSWSMEIEPSADYIENRLPEVIRKTYERKKAGVFERNTGKRNVEGIQNIKFDFFVTKDEKYLEGEMDRLAKLEEIRESVSAESNDDNDFMQKVLARFNKPRRFIMNRGTMQQRSLEITPSAGVITVIERSPQKGERKWELAPGGKMFDGNPTAIELKSLFKEFAKDIKVRSTSGEVNARLG